MKILEPISQIGVVRAGDRLADWRGATREYRHAHAAEKQQSQAASLLQPKGLRFFERCGGVARQSKIAFQYSPSSRLAASPNPSQREPTLFVRWVPAIIPFGLAVALLLSGCARGQSHYSANPDFSGGRLGGYSEDSASARPSPTKSDSQSDNAIVTAVRQSLAKDPAIAPFASNIQIAANNGAVLLNGSVQSEEQRQKISALAQQAAGVVAVNNQLQLLPGPPVTAHPNASANKPLDPTSLPNGADRIYDQNGGEAATNNNQNQ